MANTSRPLHILAINGSLAKASTNAGLLRAAKLHAEKLEGVSMTIADISELPIINTDLYVTDGKADMSKMPGPVITLREQVKHADLLLFGTTEYNFSISTPLKNALDWVSRAPNYFSGKPAGMMGTGGMGGTARCQYHLRQVGVYLNLHFMNLPELTVNRFTGPLFDPATGDLKDEAINKLVGDYVAALVKFAREKIIP